MRKLMLFFCGILSFGSLSAQETYSTYCNPVNLDYTYMIYDAAQEKSYRSGADPAVVEFRGEYYMFVTRSMGYWHSKNLQDWKFIEPEKWYFQGSNAPAAHNYKDSLLYVTGDPSGAMSLLYTDTPEIGDWQPVPYILTDLQDPAFFIDEDDQAYMYWGSSNVYPIRGKKLNRERDFRPAETVELFNLDADTHGWERLGDNHSAGVRGYLEGAWMTKHNDRYYLQYGAPGTEFNVYGDGAYIGDNPLGPFEYMPNNPFSYKPGGFINGAGHGSTVEGPDNTYWHFGTMAVSVNVRWERRIGIFRTYFDDDGLMYSDTYFGDYPHYGPSQEGRRGAFTGWMLLSYDKPVEVSTVHEDYSAENLVDEDIQSFWIAEHNDDQQWVQIDLEEAADIYAVQINYHDYESDMYGRYSDLKHQYVVEVSANGKDWRTIIDKSDNQYDVPNDYVELASPVEARYVRYNNIEVPTPHLSISDLRIFGKGKGRTLKTPKAFSVARQEDRRDALITWKNQQDAQGYNVLWGIAPDKLYNSWMVYGANELDLKSLGADQEYYFALESFNENGISDRTKPIKVK